MFVDKAKYGFMLFTSLKMFLIKKINNGFKDIIGIVKLTSL